MVLVPPLQMLLHPPLFSRWEGQGELVQSQAVLKYALLGGVEDEDKSPSGSPVRLQVKTELLSVCGLTGTPQRFSLLGLGGKGCSCCLHSVDFEGVGLRLPLLAEPLLVVCV